MKRAAERSLAKRGLSSGRYVRKRKRATMAALIVVARPGLVGVLEMFPAALHLRTLGYRVFIRCEESWYDIFECIDYAEPEIGIHSYNKIYDPSRAWATATTVKKNNWRAFIYQRFANEFGAWNNPTLTRLPNPRITNGEYCFMFGESVSRNAHFKLRFLPWLIAHAKSVEFAEPRGSDVGALLFAAGQAFKLGDTYRAHHSADLERAARKIGRELKARKWTKENRNKKSLGLAHKTHKKNRFTLGQKQQVKFLLRNGASQQQIATMLDCAPNVISLVARGKIWKNVK